MYRYFASVFELAFCSPVKVVMVWMGGLILEWWVGCPGGVRVMLQVALLFYLLDTLSGFLCVLCPLTADKFSSLRFRDAFVKLLNYAIVVLLGMGIDAIAGLGYTVTALFLSMIVMAEGLSVIENTGRLGMKYPPGFTNFFEALCRRQQPPLPKVEDDPDDAPKPPRRRRAAAKKTD